MSKYLSYPRRSYARYRTPVTDRVNLFSLLRRSLRMFRSRWWIALLTTAIGAGVATYRATTEPDVYAATSRLSIAPRVSFSSRSGDRAFVREEQGNFSMAQLEYMRSSVLLGKVAEKMPEYRAADGSTPAKSLSVNQGQGSTFIMSVTSPNLQYARHFARTWAQEFLLFKEDMLGDVARRNMDRVRTDLSRQEEQLLEAQQRLDDYLQEHQIATSQDTGNAAQGLLNNLQNRRQSVMLQRQRLEMKSAAELADERSEPTSVLASTPPPSSPDSSSSSSEEEAPAAEPVKDSPDPLDKFVGQSSYRGLKLALNGLQAEMQRQSEFLKSEHPFMVQLRRRIVETERQIGDQLTLIDEIRKARIVSLKQEETVLDRQIEAQRAEVVRLRDVHREFVRRTQAVESTRRSVEQLGRDLQALAQIESADEVFRVLEEGVGSDKPVGPNRMRIILMGVAIGLAAGIGLTFLLHKLDDRVESAEELEKALEEPILGQIPMVSRRDAKDGFISVDKLNPNNIFVEAFRGVRSSVMFGDLGGAKQVLMVTSSVPGDGKSTFTVNFAITLAKAGNRVLLVDADLRRGTVAQYFDLPMEPGFTDVLSGLENWTDVLHATPHRTLLAITAGKAVTNPGELLLSKVIRRFVEEARGEFDFIIFDSPPVIGMDDAASLSSNCDGLIFVYRVGATSLKLAKLAVNTTRQRGGRILGMILNGVTLGNTDYYYTAYYYSHYAYGQKGARAVAAPPEGTPIPRPEGARLLTALRSEGIPAAATGAPRAALLDEEPETTDVEVLPAPGERNDAPGVPPGAA